MCRNFGATLVRGVRRSSFERKAAGLLVALVWSTVTPAMAEALLLPTLAPLFVAVG